MGWTGIPKYPKRKLTTQEMNAEAERLMQNDHQDILDWSGWQTYDHRFALVQWKDGVEPHLAARRAIIVIIADQRVYETRFKLTSEAEGHGYVDCPLRLLKADEEYPPHNQWAAEWRQKVHNYHEDRLDLERLWRELDAALQNGNAPLVLHEAPGLDHHGDQRGDQQVQYRRGRFQGKNVRCYHGPNGLTMLRPERINRAATRLALQLAQAGD